mmetsp:Transcript_69728/g.111535  ORF Transcript_69728/g.111535 Transcript_69728/m.111535 type:complete len:214 (-) Transcript_69728:461-1102(-)
MNATAVVMQKTSPRSPSLKTAQICKFEVHRSQSVGRPAGRIGQPVGRSIEPSVNQGGRQAVHLPVRPSNSQSVSQSVLMEVAGVCIGGCWRLLEVAEGCIRDCWRMPRIWRVVPSVTPQLSARPVPKHCFGLNPSFRCGRCTAQKHWSTTTHAEVGEPDEAVNDDEVRPADVQEVGAALGFVLPPRPNVSEYKPYKMENAEETEGATHAHVQC